MVLSFIYILIIIKLILSSTLKDGVMKAQEYDGKQYKIELKAIKDVKY